MSQWTSASLRFAFSADREAFVRYVTVLSKPSQNVWQEENMENEVLK